MAEYISLEKALSKVKSGDYIVLVSAPPKDASL